MAERVVKVRLTAQIAEYATAMTEAANKTRAVGTEAERAAQKREAFQTLGTAALIVGGAMTALTLSVAKTGIEYNTLQQTSRAALSTLLGGAEAANAQMDKLDAFARTSPFSKSTFITAQQQMLAFGIESKKVIPYLDAIQEAVAAAGGSNQQLGEIAFIMAQISSAGKITAQDLMQFGQRGVNAAELIGSQMGKTGAEIRKEITAGALGADAALDALASGMKERFDGASANVKETFVGALDRMKAAWRDLSSDLMKPLVDPSGGGALVDFLNWTADVMRAFQSLPEPIKLTGGALFALAGFVALVSGTVLTATPRIVAMRVAFMNLSATMRGFAIVGGGAVIALTAVIAIVGAVAAAHAAAEQKAQSYADALEQGADAARRLAAENATAESSFLWISRGSAADAADTLGVSLDLVADAAMGNADALDQVNKVLDTAYAEAYEQSMKDVTDQQAAAGEASAVLREYLEAETAAYENGTKKLEQKNRMAEEGTEVSKSAADAYLDEADAVSDLVSQMTGLIDKINEANGVNQDAVTANARYQDALAGISEEVQRQRDAYEEAHGSLDGFVLSLDESTAAGSANASSLAAVASAAQDAALKQFEVDQATMSAEDATNKYSGTLAAQRQAFIDSAVQAGYNAAEVQKLADKVFALPSEKEIQILAETAAAQNDIDRLVINNNGRRITITADVNYQSAGGITVTPNAAGGLYENGVKAFAAGGMEPGIYPYTPGGIHKFAEQYAEGYVSLDPARRSRSEGVWRAIGNHMGFTSGYGSGPSADQIGAAVAAALGRGLRGVANRPVIVAIDGQAIASAVNNENQWG